MIWTVSQHRTIRDLDAARWDRLAATSAFATHGWLLTLETCRRAAVEPLYMALWCEGRLIAGVACYVANAGQDMETLDDLLFGRVAALARAIGQSRLPALVCGPLVGYGWHIGVDPDVDEPEADRARRLVFDAVEAEAARRGLEVSLVHVLDQERGLCALLAERGYLRCRNIPTAVLDVPWASYDEYLHHLSRKTRSEVRRQANRSRESGHALERLVDPDEAVEAPLQALVDENSRRHSGRPWVLGPSFFRTVTREVGPDVHVFVCRGRDGVRGVSVMLRRGDAAYPVVVGADAGPPRDHYAYFEVTYHAVIACAIELGIRRLYFGRGLADVKQRRGCRFVETWEYAQARGSRRPLAAAWFAVASWWNRRKLSARVRRAFTDRAGEPS